MLRFVLEDAITSSSAAPADPFEHRAYFYRGVTDYLSAVVPFVTEGLAAGDPVAVAVPEPNLRAVRDAVGDDGAAVRWFDMTEAGRNPGRIIPGVLLAAANGHARHVRIVGEPLWRGRSPMHYPACAQHEALINAAFRGREATILCPYDADGLPPDVLADAAATHPLLTDTTGTRASDRYDPDRIVAACNQPLPPPPAGATELAVRSAELGDARRRTAAYAAGLGFTAERSDELVLAVDELLTNSIAHGGGSGTLLMWSDGEHLVCEVRDLGHLTEPLAGRLPAAPHQLGGRGLLLVNQLADLVRTYTTPAGTSTRAHFALPRHTARQSSTAF